MGLKYLIDRTGAYAPEEGIRRFLRRIPALPRRICGLPSKAQAFGTLVGAGDSDSILDAAAVIRDSAASLRTHYENTSAAYRTLSSSKELGGIINFTFYQNGEPLKCYPNSNATAALARVQNEFSDKSIQSPARLLDIVLAFTAERGADASKGTAAALRAEAVAKVDSSVSNLSAQFAGSGYTVDLKALVTKKDALKKSLATANSTAQAEAIDAGVKEIDAALPSYQAAVAPFKNASVSIKAASDNVTAAQKKYGEADTRIQALTTELNGVKTNMSAAISLLSSGDPVKASAQFTALAQQGSDLRNAAALCRLRATT